MQFACPACEGTFELSRRAFGNRSDTRTRCAACKTWLIVTRSPDDSLVAAIDPATEPDPAAVEAARQAMRERVAAPVAAAAPAIGPARQPSAARPATRSTMPTFGMGPASRPSAPGSLQAQVPPVPAEEPQIVVQEASPGTDVVPPAVTVFFPDKRRPATGQVEKLPGGFDKFALPDPADRDGRKRVQMQQVLQDFSMMFRLETKKSDRQRVVLVSLVVLLAGAGLWWAITEKMAYDARLDAARDAKKALPAFVLQAAQPEDVAVLAMPGDPSQTAEEARRSWHGTALSRQLFMKVRSDRSARGRGPR